MKGMVIGFLLGVIVATGAGVLAQDDDFSFLYGLPPGSGSRGSFSGTIIPGGTGLNIYNDNKGNSGTVMEFGNGMKSFNFSGPGFGKSPC